MINIAEIPHKHDVFFSEITTEKTKQIKKSHLKYLNLCKNGGNVLDFKNIVMHFIQTGKKKSYCLKVLQTLATHFTQKIQNYENPLKDKKKLIHLPYRNAVKFKSNQLYFDINGNPIHILFTDLGKFTTAKIETNPSDVLAVHKYATDIVNEFIVEYDENKNLFFILKTLPFFSKTNDILECCLLILFLFDNGARNNEIIKLTIQQCSELIMKKFITIYCKTGFEKLRISSTFANTLEKYIEKKKRTNYSLLLLFTCGKNVNQIYKKLLNVFHKIWWFITKKSSYQIGFHIFRHYFAYRGKQIDFKYTNQILRHHSSKTTENYGKLFNHEDYDDFFKKL